MFKAQLMILGVLPAPEQSFSTQHACAVTVKQALVSTNTLANTDCVRKLFATQGTCAHTQASHYNYPSAELLVLIVQPDVGMYALITSDVQSLRIYIQTDALKYSRNKGTLPYIICLLEMNTIINICIREYDLSNKTGTY